MVLADEEEEAVVMMEEEVTTEEAEAGCVVVEVELERPTRLSSHVHLLSTCSVATTRSSKHVTPAQRIKSNIGLLELHWSKSLTETCAV